MVFKLVMRFQKINIVHCLVLMSSILCLFFTQHSLAQHSHDNHSSPAHDSVIPIQQLVGSGSVSLNEAIQAQAESLGTGHNQHADENKSQEHQVLLGMFPLASDPQVAVALNGGSWFDVNTWSTGVVPGAGDNVYIPHGISVIYDHFSEAELNRVAVDGQLHFSVSVDTRLVVDTLLTGPRSVFTIGDAHNPVAAERRAELIFHLSNGSLNIDEDPTLLSKGLVSHGSSRIVGWHKTTHLKALVAPRKNDTFLLLKAHPEHWHVGDKLVVAATNNELSSRTKQFERYQDEVVTIASISLLANGSARIDLDQALQFNHIPPNHSTDVDLQVSVANYSRNVFIGTKTSNNAYLENGKTVPISQRGHVMFMHSDDVVVKNAEFYELGRTDKSAFFSNTNVAGRYSLHFHRTGLNDLANPVIAQGNAIWGSPGWGIVHHDANVNVDSNAVFGVVGSGIVAEAGNETGRWIDNIVIQTTGAVRTFNAEQSRDSAGNVPIDHPAYQAEVLNNSFMQGEAYGMKSRLLKISGNIAVSANGAGFSFWPHGADGPSHIGANSKSYEFSQGYDPFYGQTGVYPGKVPTRDFHANEVVASRHALNTSANKIAHRHDMDVIIEDLLSWNVDQPIMSFYQENYIIKDSVFIRGVGNTPVGQYYNGVGGGSSATHIHDPVDFKLINNYFEGFDTITKEPFEIILGNTVIGSSVSNETGPNGRFREGATADNDSIDILNNSSNWRNHAAFSNPVGFLTASVNVSASDLVMTESYDRFSVVINKIDTIGHRQLAMGSQREKEFRGASQTEWWKQNAVSDGYYLRNGAVFLIVETTVSDRVSGTVGVIEAAIELKFLNGDPSGLPVGSFTNGALPSRINNNYIGTFRIVDKREIGKVGNQLFDPQGPTPATIYGFGFGGKNYRQSYSASYGLSNIREGARLCLKSHSINSRNEVSITINGILFGFLPVGLGPKQSCFDIPSHIIVRGSNDITFTQSNPGEVWGVSEIRFNPIHKDGFMAAIFMLLLDD